MVISKESVTEILKSVVHPEQEQDIVASGMVGALEITDSAIKFNLELKRPRDPFAYSLKKICEQKLATAFPEYKDKIVIFVKEPSPKAKSAAKQENKGNASQTGEIRNIIAVSSGKGGVGKSTVTANLAVTLARMGYKAGVIDADIYGPSMPQMLGVEGYVPLAVQEEGQELLVPAENYGVELMSIGFFIRPDDALVWRGPMATNALRQLIHQTKWGALDFLLIDLPPGTGDIHLTMMQELKFTGAVIVSTPQKVALADVVRGIQMFRAEKIDVPVLGLIENMAWFTPLELPENKYYIFGKEGCKELAEKEHLPLLGQIPIVQSVREGSDEGKPGALFNPILGEVFGQTARNLIGGIESLSAKQ